MLSPFVDLAQIPNKVGTPASLATAQKIVDKSVTLVKNDTNTLPLSNTREGAGHRLGRRHHSRRWATSLTNRGATSTVARPERHRPTRRSPTR